MTAPVPQTLPIDIALQQALTHHQAGRLSEAEDLYRAILQAYPSQPDANYNDDIAVNGVSKERLLVAYYDAKQFTRDLEKAYRDMWTRWCAKPRDEAR